MRSKGKIEAHQNTSKHSHILVNRMKWFIEPKYHIRLAISVHLLAHKLQIDNTLLTVSDDIVESVKLEESDSDVAELDYHVEDEQIVSVSLTNHTTSLSCSLSHTGQASISVLTSVSYIAAEM